MRKILLILICSLQLSVIGWSSSSTTAPLHHCTTAPYHHITISPYHQLASESFDSLWYQVDSLANAGLPKSALDVIDQIYSQAEELKNDPQLVKAILYRISLNSTFEENSLLGAIDAVKREIEITREPVTQILHSILGDLYSSYYQWNQYRFNSRSTLAGGISDNPETWDTRRIFYEIIRNYRQSLWNETELQGIPLENYRAILEYPLLNSGKKDTTPSFHKTLFDFLAQRALSFFTTNNSPVIQSSTTFTLNNPAFFAQPVKFTSYPLKPQGIHARPGDGTFIPAGNDTLSLSWYAIQIYQVLTRFHLNNKNPEALIDWELKRFSYVLNKSTLIQKDSLYLEALREFEKSYNFSPASAEISYALAQALVQGGGEYNPLVSGAHQWDLKDALTVCMEAAGRFPESLGGKNCRSLIKQIMAPSLKITAEYAVIPEQPSLASLSYQTIPSLYFRLVKADPEAYQITLSGLKQEDIFKYLISKEVVSRWEVTLPSIGDYQEHRTEFSIPSAAPGFYLLFASADSLFRNSDEPFTYQAIWSSGISYITQRNEQGGVDIYLLDRETGFPLKNCSIEAFSKSYDSRSRKYISTKTGVYRSNESGFFTLPAPLGKAARSNLFLTIRNGNDLLITQPLYVYALSDRTERTVEQTRFYTDRSIYRPGQPVYFKGIVLERTGDSTALKPGKKTLVTFTDVNNQKIDDQWYTTDEYGSFNGIFTTPTGVLLGEMRIFNESGSTVISVEEYKRPTFEVIFNPMEGNYKLGEKVSVSGKATGYAGNAIDAGSVNYRVVRTATYPFFGGWWRIPYPPSPEVEIANGTSLTGENGSFAIEFEALPDLSIPAEQRPVFTFQVYADVTDINGETRSAREAISVGYTSLLINITIPEKVNLSDEGKFMLSTTNLNGKSTPAEVHVTLQKLAGPDRAFKSRQWEQPDTMIIPKKEFYTEFPHDIYGKDNDPSTWEVEETLFNNVVNTSKDSVLMLTDTGYEIGDKEGKNRGSRIADPGSYKLTLTANDPFGQKVVKILYFTAFDPAAKRPPIAEINWFVPLKTSGEPGETASFLIGTSEKEVRVIREIRVKYQLFSREWLTLKNQQKVVEVPILEEFRGNFSVNFLFVRENRVFQNNQVVTVPYTDKKLDIVIESFRNKLVPGQHEEWKIRITDAAGNGLSASLLATMYDRSLDLFRDHSWSFNLYKRYYSGDPWDVNDDFKTTGGSWYASWRFSSEFHYRRYSQLNWFGWQQMGLGSYGYPLISKDASVTRSGLKDTYSMEAETFGTPVQGLPPTMDDVSRMEKQESVPKQSPENQDVPLIPVRKDFRETAFFYPSLVSDTSGNLLLKFTVPEALTSWKMMGLAYTKTLDYGQVEKELITQKDVMVFPNTPRFVRQGDTVVFIARVVNLSDHEISGEATLNLAEAIT
ncbi:alpha-2-macroglobulin family protein, partial [Bacteroidota bacterium]